VIDTLLKREGHAVIAVPDAAAALEVLKTLKVALVIADAGTPGVGGATFTEIVRSASRDVPILYLYAPVAVTEMRPAAKGVSYLVKPFTPTSLLARVRRLLEIRRSDRKP
jgi:DNA-binding response OmpR family regulator